MLLAVPLALGALGIMSGAAALILRWPSAWPPCSDGESCSPGERATGSPASSPPQASTPPSVLVIIGLKVAVR